MGIITRESIDLFMPRHDKTSCSDEHTINCYREEHGGCECRRCYLLEFCLGKDVSELNVNLELSIHPKYLIKMVEVREVVQD